MVNSIGLIESKGLVALIEAADVILKNSPVKILGIKKLDNGLVSLAVSGKSDYVKAAIESAVESGRRVGEIYASTVVDDPGVELMILFNDLFSFTKKAESPLDKIKFEKDSEAVVDINVDSDIFAPITKKVQQGLKREESKPLSVTKNTHIHNTKKRKHNPAATKNDKLDNSFTEKTEEIKKDSKQSDKFPISEKPLSTLERLRIEALGLSGKKISKKENSFPVKEKTKETKDINPSLEISGVDFDAIDKMNVHKLRKYAREFPEFPIKGRAISRSNRAELVELFKSITNK